MPDRAAIVAIVAAVEAYCQAQSTKDADAWAALFAEDVFHEDPVGVRQSRGKSHVVSAFWDHIVRNDVHIWLTDEVIVCGDEALAIMACEIGPPGAYPRSSTSSSSMATAGSPRCGGFTISWRSRPHRAEFCDGVDPVVSRERRRGRGPRRALLTCSVAALGRRLPVRLSRSAFVQYAGER